MSEVYRRVLITGSNGLLGQKLVQYCQEKNITYLATANSENKLSFCPNDNFKIMDITNMEKVGEVIHSFQPTHIINTAAMTNVDACEDKEAECFDVNAKGVANILDEIRGTEIHLLHISTDFIFDGKKKIYDEEDAPNPLNNYGKSKLGGEKVILKNEHPKITILRTSIVYGVGESLNKGNIFSWALKELRKGEELNIVNDQFRTPTFVDDLVQACDKTMDKSVYGVYNIAGNQLLSMYDYIVLVAKYLNVNPSQVKATSSKQLNQKALRPQSSGLNITKAKSELGYRPTGFVESLSKIDR